MYDYLNKLNKNQRRAVATIKGPLLIIAGAGSGKTTVLINRLRYMVDIGIEPSSILLLTFTNAAANNMIERATMTGSEKCSEATACTYHSFCAKMLRMYGRYINVNEDFSLITPSETNDAIKFVKAQNKKYDLRGFPKNSVVSGIISKSINKRMTIPEVIEKEYYKYISYTNEIVSLAKDYEAYKHEKNILDYDDLLLLMLKLLHNNDVRKRINNKYKYIMVDEYQDTNILQEDIVMLLAGETKNIAVVGDDYQSIYAFRGSDINNILHFPDKFKNCSVVTIDVNYRSTKEILDVANKVMDKYANFGFKKQMIATKTGDKVVLKRPIDQDAEAKSVLKDIKRIIKNTNNPKEIAILVRNSGVSSRLELLLTNENISYKKLGGIKFMENACVLDMLAYLRVITNPYDELAWFRVLDNIPGIGDMYATNISKNCKNSDFLLDKRYRRNLFYKYLVRLNNFINEVKNMEDFPKQLDGIIKYYVELKREKISKAKLKDEGDRTDMLDALENVTLPILNQLKDIALEEVDAISFLDSLVLNASPGKKEEDDCITISTIHSAKGMEWDNVIMMGCADEVFPRYTVYENTYPEYSEELRCFYVALTRARNNLIIYAPQNVNNYGNTVSGPESHFLSDCHDLMDVKNKRTKSIVPNKIYLNVPYREKDGAKAFGAKWDWNMKMWYIFDDYENINCFERWMQ